MNIRKYQSKEESILYQICLATGDDGKNASTLFADDTLLGHLYVGPYLHFEPDFALCLVTEDDTAVGYCLAAPNTPKFYEQVSQNWIHTIQDEYKTKDKTNWKAKDFELYQSIVNFHYVHNAELQAYPAHLHIDIIEDVQGMGWGRRLIQEQIKLLQANAAEGVHLELSAANNRAKGFYEHLGFEPLPNNAGRDPSESLVMGYKF